MRRFGRRIFNILAALSLLPCIAACALWVRSYQLMDEVTWTHIGGVQWVRAATGHLDVGTFAGYSPSGPGDPFGFKYTRDQPFPPINISLFLGPDLGDKNFSWERAGFALYSKTNAVTGFLHAQFIAPFWSIAALTAVVPLGWFMLWRWSRIRNRLGLCPVCWYDLRATPNRCPECGAVIARIGIAKHDTGRVKGIVA